MTDARPAPSMQQKPDTWDLISPTYAEDAWQWTKYAHEALRLLPVATDQRVLDVAAGPGTLAFEAAKHGARVDATDFSPGMVEQLRARATREGVKNVEGAVMDAGSLAFPDGTFDAAFCLFGFMFFPDRAQVFREMHRVLKPGGRALVATWSPIERRPLMKIAFDTMAEVMPHLPRPSKGDLQETDECVREMKGGGFRDVVAHLREVTVHFESSSQYLDTIVRSAAPFAVMRKMMGDEAFLATKAQLFDAVRTRLPDGAFDLAAEAILTVGTR